MKKHINIPVFIPHLGCPNQCVFCNQRIISGVQKFDVSSVKKIIDEALETVSTDTTAEIAFFGGSFTGIERSLMIELLEIGKSYVDLGRVTSIRCSTRPDYIDPEILGILKEYGVKTIELGLQSVSSDVLLKTKRGHTSKDEEDACRLIVERGFDLVGQMMIGLPGATLEDEIETARFIVKMGAVGARIYPTVVFCDTELSALCKSGEYQPLSVEEATRRSAAAMEVFIRSGVKVIRVGLCSSENLTSEDTYFAGPNHPAIGELVENEIYYNRILESLFGISTSGRSLKVYVPRGSLSKAIGQNKKNKIRLMIGLGLIRVDFKECDTLEEYEVRTVI